MRVATDRAEPGRMNVATDRVDAFVARHLRIGWCALLVFGTLGLVLESLHGFKVRWLVDVSNETRRLMWTLAHAHGTVLGLVHIGFAATLRLGPPATLARLALASSCLSAALVAIPLGFFLGGAFAYAGDPGIGVVLVPIGAAAFLMACAIVALALLPSSAQDRRSDRRAAIVRSRPSNDVPRKK